ncbi:hypothetical protein [Plantactinospora sp. CA-290183]|uniref:hypothetical protein n=1 Tax=Plantactinospora sp. CA-290183 TaxID=3240006 RepID=UPI003D8B8169
MVWIVRGRRQAAGSVSFEVSAAMPGQQREAVRLRPWHRPLVLMVASLLLAAAGCGSDDGRSAPDPTLSVSAPVPDARAMAEEQALQAYRGMWQAYATAGLAANADEPDLPRYASGQALTTLRQGLAALRRDGEVIKGEYGSSPRVADASPADQPATVRIRDCLDGSNFLTYKATGELADDEPGGRRSTEATVAGTGAEGWKVIRFAIQEVGTC